MEDLSLDYIQHHSLVMECHQHTQVLLISTDFLMDLSRVFTMVKRDSYFLVNQVSNQVFRHLGSKLLVSLGNLDSQDSQVYQELVMEYIQVSLELQELLMVNLTHLSSSTIIKQLFIMDTTHQALQYQVVMVLCKCQHSILKLLLLILDSLSQASTLLSQDNQRSILTREVSSIQEVRQSHSR